MESSRSLCFVPSQGPPFSGDDGHPPKALQLSSGNVGFNGSDASFDDFKTDLVDNYHLGEAPSILNSRTTNVEGGSSHLEERSRRRRKDGARSYPWRRRNFIRYELDSERYRAYRLKSSQNSDQKWVILKGYLKDNENWMKLVTAEHKDAAKSSCHVLSPPTRILGSNAPPFIRQIEFEMFLEDAATKRLHTFTSIQSEIGSALRPLENVHEWEKYFPHLAAYYQRHGHIDSELISLETEIELLRDHPPHGSRLCINPFIVVAGGVNYQDWRSTTRLYEKGSWVRDARKGVELDKHAQELPAENLENSPDTKLILPIKSSWWAHNVIAEILTRITTARTQGDPSAEYRAEQWGRQFLANISMMQEISAMPRNGDSSRVVAILLWKFRQTKPGETATTTWRKLTPPSPQIHLDAYTQAPAALVTHSPTILDATLQGEPDRDPAAYGDEQYPEQPSFFVEDPESIITGQPSQVNSGSSTPTPDLQSLPSSTATSFASSGSGSLHHDHHVARSTYGFEDAAYHSQDLHSSSQGSLYQDSAYGTQSVKYESQDIEYLDPGYPDSSEAYPIHHRDPNGFFQYHDQQLNESSKDMPLMTRHHSSQYSVEEHHDHAGAPELFPQRPHHSHDTILPTLDHSTEDDISPNFTGGQIQISLDEHADLLLAPEADTLPQQNSFRNSSLEVPEAPQGESEMIGEFRAERRDIYCSASQDLANLDDEGGMQPIAPHQEERHCQAFLSAETIQRRQQGELVLHHPQPHQSLQHHLDSAQWQTHTLWSHAENERNGICSNFEADIAHNEMQDQIPDFAEDEFQEAGHIIGEVSRVGERDIDEIERDMAREIRRDLSGIELED
ncbi:MAG: hypothetical protein Q9195_001757 [Heterodermia aff. obscurata]